MAFEEFEGHPYISLITFRRGGQPVATPVQFVRDGDRLLVNTGRRSGKVKRIRHTPHGTIAPCDIRGRLKSEPVEVTIALLDRSGWAEAWRLLMQASSLFQRILWAVSNSYRRLIGRADDRVWLEITEAQK